MKAFLAKPINLFRLSFKSVRLFRFKSIFTTILASMISLCIALCIIFSIFFTNTIVSNTAKQQVETNQAFLSTVVGNVDYLILNLHQSLTQLSYNHNVFTLAFSTQINKEHAMDNANLAMTDIALTAENNPLIESSILYIPSLKTVITSSYNVYAFDEYAYREMIRSHENHLTDSVTIENNGTMSSLFPFYANYILARDFPLNGDRRLATIYYFIDTHELYRHLVGKLSENTSIWVYDKSNSPVFARETKYPSGITSDTISKLEASAKHYINSGQTTVFFLASEVSGWKYLYVIDRSSLKPAAGSILSVLLPIMLLILIAASMVSLLIASMLYRPFHSLLNAIESKNLAHETLPPFKNEVDYLTYAFSEIEGHQFKLQTMMRNVSNDVMTRLFLDLLSGVQISYQSIEEILKNVQSPFQINAPYVACVLQCPKELTLSESQRLTVISELNTITDVINKKYGTLSYVLMVGSHTLVILLSFHPDSHIMNIKKVLADLESTLKTMSKEKGIAMLFGAGHLYQSILDVGFSYMEALSALSVQNELQNSDFVSSVGSTDADFNTRTQQVLSLVLNNDAKGAQVLLERIMDDIPETASDIKTQVSCYDAFVTSLTDKIVRLEYIDPSSISNDWLMSAGKQEGGLDAESLASLAKNSCLKMIGELAKILKKQQNRFVVAAQEYIAKHYFDCNLSLNSIAEAIGSNPSYLSRLFKENLGVHFTDYLNEYRVDCSIRFFENKEKSIKDISLECGFSSVQNYIRVFKKHIGKTPGQYRDSMPKTEGAKQDSF